MWHRLRRCSGPKMGHAEPTLFRNKQSLIQRGYSLRKYSQPTVPSNMGDVESQGALTGLKILDLSRVLAARLFSFRLVRQAPFCSQILADYGADVIKVETVDKGDDTRHWQMTGEAATWKTSAGPISNYFSAVNRNKRSITLNLKQEKGKEILKKLALSADVVIENFKPGTMENLGLGYETLREENPKLIYASLSGYGRSGPYAKRGGYDPIAAAEAGLLHITGERNGPPVRVGLGMVDMSTGLYLHGAILAAVIARQRDGLGQRVDTSLFGTQVSMLINVGLSWLNMGIEAQRWGCQHPSIAPYDAFETKDAYLVCGATNDVQFSALCGLLGLGELAKEERFATNPKRVENRDILGPMFNDVFRTKTTAEWVPIFEATGLPFGPINNMERTFAHPQTEALGMVNHVKLDAAESGQLCLIGPAVKFSRTETSFRRAPPTLGQHTSEVLKELEMDSSDMTLLKEQKVV
ncbi:unnamed protein product [Clonostachys rhizophaga]|uniref:Succinate--hydroxymethylglutarate CoA-transferase n=1 Tax=Clonostachys rhizophaga TaxID=160324 RepID=A0A9N9YTI5_9HYPO|nr:unnamed protein product [Clonostachys rhizophaga]